MGIDRNTAIALISLPSCAFRRQKEIGTWLQHRVYHRGFFYAETTERSTVCVATTFFSPFLKHGLSCGVSQIH